MIPAQIEGPVFNAPENQPDSVAEYICKLIEAYPRGEYIEIDFRGDQHISSNTELYERALEILAVIQQEDNGDNNSQFVVICLESALDFIPAVWACLFNGNDCVPWWSQAIQSRDEEEFTRGMEALLEEFETALVITDKVTKEKLDGSVLSFSRYRLFDIHDLPVVPQRRGEDFRLYSHRRHPSDFLISTSGTTGKPKLARLDNRTVINRFYDGFTRDELDVNLYCLPFHTVTGIALIKPRRKVIYLHPYRLAACPEELLTLVSRFDVSAFGLSSSMAGMINRALDKVDDEYDLSSITSVGFGAETIVPYVIKQFLENLQNNGMGDSKVGLIYGLTEGGPVCRANWGCNQLIQVIHTLTDSLVLGRPVEGWQLRITDENGIITGEGVSGQIQIWSPDKLFVGYYENPVLNKDKFSSDGWFTTGDLGVISGGELRVIGRDSDTVIINARKFSCEQFEEPLRSLDGLRMGIVIAAPLRMRESTTDELAIFFTPDSFEQVRISEIGQAIIREVSLRNKVTVRHLVPLMASEIERTPTNKIKRKKLVERYQQGEWKNTLEPTQLVNPKFQVPLSLETEIGKLWCKALGLHGVPAGKGSFFDLGGDSLAAARLFTAVEERYPNVSMTTFFLENPTVSRLVNLVRQEVEGGAVVQSLATDNMEFVHNSFDLIKEIRAYVSSWQGERLLEDSMVVGLNTAGTGRPIFWIFQEYSEFHALAEEFGSDQPLYGMRSCAGILRVKHYSSQTVREVVNRYFLEIMALADEPIMLGGNCQGAMLALLVAQKLSQAGEAPALLTLMEWSFSLGAYTDPVLILYGEDSHTAKIYSEGDLTGPDWRADFPNNKVSSIPGAHGQFFSTSNIKGLASKVSYYAGA